MGIVFFCQSCGARFEVDPRMAGKKGRCRHCGQHMMIPRAEELTSMTALPALAGAGAGVGAGVSAPTGHRGVGRTLPVRSRPSAEDEPPPSIVALLKAGISQVGLAPLPVDRIPPRPALPSALDDAEDSRPYQLAAPVVDNRGPVRIQDNTLIRLWRRVLGDIQKIFRWLNDSAYFVSIPFVMILLFGAAVKNRPVALFGASFVVLLNIGRLAAGAVNLALVPLRDGLNTRKLKKPVRRVVEPIATIALVVLAFTFVPWLTAGGSARGSLANRVRAGAEGLEKDIAREVGGVLDKAKTIDVDKLGSGARQKLNELAEPKPDGNP